MDAYIRVSRVGDREGEAYRAPGIQRDEIERWAKNNGVEVGKVVQEDDVSGARPVVQRGLEALIKRAEQGASRGVLVHRVDRFARDHTETIITAKRLKDADARLVGVTDGVDSDQPHGKWLLNFMSLQAEDYLDRVRQNWHDVTTRAVSDGVHIACRAPVGYLRADQATPAYDDRGRLVRNGRLVVDSDTGPAVRGAFELRAAGASYQEVVDHLRSALGRGMAKSSVTGIFRNRAYLGEARGPGGLVKKDAHEALVTADLFAAVQPRREGYRRTGSVANQARLGGLAVCASCGHKLRVMGSTNQKTGEREASYVCAAKYATQDCDAPVAARVKLVDEHVAQLLSGAWEDVRSLALSAEQQFLEAREAVRSAEEALDAWVDDPTISTELGRDRFQRGLLARQGALDAARRALWALDDPSIPEDQSVVWIDGKPQLYERWGDDAEADRRLLRRHIASVTVAKADPRRRRWQPIGERVAVRWVGE